MSDMQARLRQEHRIRYSHLTPNLWYDVCPVFPGVTTRRTDIFGQRLARLRTRFGFETVKADHFEFRSRPVEDIGAINQPPVSLGV